MATQMVVSPHNNTPCAAVTAYRASLPNAATSQQLGTKMMEDLCIMGAFTLERTGADRALSSVLTQVETKSTPICIDQSDIATNLNTFNQSAGDSSLVP